MLTQFLLHGTFILLHGDPTLPVHWLEHWIKLMAFAGGLFILLIVGVWIYLKEQERKIQD